MVAGADVGGGGIAETPASLAPRAPACDDDDGPVGHDGLKKVSLSDRFDVGAGANSMRGVTSVSETEVVEDEDDGAAGADRGTGGN